MGFKEEAIETLHTVQNALEMVSNAFIGGDGVEDKVNSALGLHEEASSINPTSQDDFESAYKAGEEMQEKLLTALKHYEDAVDLALRCLDELNESIVNLGRVSDEASTRTGEAMGHISEIVEKIQEMQDKSIGSAASRVEDINTNLQVSIGLVEGELNSMGA